MDADTPLLVLVINLAQHKLDSIPTTTAYLMVQLH